MFKYLVISVIIVPALIGVLAARARSGAGSPRLLALGWLAYSFAWIGLLHFLRYRWAW